MFTYLRLVKVGWIITPFPRTAKICRAFVQETAGVAFNPFVVSMSPIFPGISSIDKVTSALLPRSFSDVRTQWQNPGDLLSILLILGGDVVQTAIAQLSGGHYYFAPVAFSFGWVAYSVTAVLLAWGDRRLMPKPDASSVLINARSEQIRSNESWVLSRILRDYKFPGGGRAGHLLRVEVFETNGPAEDKTEEAKGLINAKPAWDGVMYTGVAVIVAQCVIAAIPGILYGAWDIMVVTSCGTFLALLGSAFREWRREKWPCRRIRSKKPQTICLTPGSGSWLVIVIICKTGSLNLEDLASAAPRYPISYTTKAFTVILAVCWVILLLTVAGIKENAWYLLAVGALGSVQNVFAAGTHRKPKALGIHIQKVRSIVPDQGVTKLFAMLQKVEQQYRWVGLALLPVFFPSGLRPDEIHWRDITKRDNLEKEAEEKAAEAIQQKELAKEAKDITMTEKLKLETSV